MTFDPATLAGKVLWLRAKDNAGGNGSSVTTWSDQSGFAKHGTSSGTAPTVATASTPLGGKSVRFGGAGMLAFPNLEPTVANSDFGAGYEAWHAVDGDTATFWHSANGAIPATLSVVLTAAYAATSYTMTPRGIFPGRDPYTWTFQGSNDRSAWTTLDTQTAQTFSGSTPRTFTFTNITAYLYYRLNISAVNGDTYAQLAELAITGATISVLLRGEIWAVIKSDGSGANQGVWRFGSNGTRSFYPLSDGNLYDNFGSSSSQVNEGAAVLSTTSWRIYRITSSGTAWVASLDGTTQISAGAQTAGWEPAPYIGGTGMGATADAYFNGNIAELLLRAQVSTTQEVSDITAYLTAEHFTAAASAASLTATSTLTVTAADTVLPAVALVAASSLTSAAAGVGVLSGAASLVATSSLTATATITEPAAVTLVASSTLTPTMAPATMVSLVAASSLTANAATPVSAVVALSATSTLTTAGTVIVSGVVSLGAVTVAAGLAVTLDMAQPGTLANPYAASDSDTRSLDFASALFVATEPVALTGPPAAPSVWYEFTESQVADWLASTSSFAHGADIELYSGPPGAGPDDLTFIATDGSSLVTLGAVTVSALVTAAATSLRAQLVDLGAVAVAAGPAVAVVLS